MVELAIALGVLGAAMGSFIDALTWRLHTKRNFVSDRSECEHCHHKLSVLDLVPILSWVMLGGRCRYCRKPISPLVPLVEVTMAVLFVVSCLYWPLGFAQWQAVALFGLWLVYLVFLGALFVYDLRWMLLPDVLVYPLIGLGFIDAALRLSLVPGATVSDYAAHVVLGVLAMAGIYWLLYTISKGRWVGFGDVKLAIFMGLVLGWQKTLLVLMLANVIGLLVVVPGLVGKKLTPKSHVPFGPFMIAAFVIVGLFGDRIIEWYLHTFILL
jgi:prepilin signal peptidase PulO-like enzyme (type II secretory pathway)